MNSPPSPLTGCSARAPFLALPQSGLYGSRFPRQLSWAPVGLSVSRGCEPPSHSLFMPFRPLDPDQQRLTPLRPARCPTTWRVLTPRPLTRCIPLSFPFVFRPSSTPASLPPFPLVLCLFRLDLFPLHCSGFAFGFDFPSLFPIGTCMWCTSRQVRLTSCSPFEFFRRIGTRLARSRTSSYPAFCLIVPFSFRTVILVILVPAFFLVDFRLLTWLHHLGLR